MVKLHDFLDMGFLKNRYSFTLFRTAKLYGPDPDYLYLSFGKTFLKEIGRST